MSRMCEGSEPLTSLEKQTLSEAQEIRDQLCDLELNVERLRLTALRLRAVVLAAREFAHCRHELMTALEFAHCRHELMTTLRDLDEHDAHHGIFLHLREARRRGLSHFEPEDSK